MKYRNLTLICMTIIGCIVGATQSLIIQHSDERFIAVAPHHLITAETMEKFYSDLSAQLPRIDSIVIIGPNHYGEGSQFFESVPETATYCYDTHCRRIHQLEFFETQPADFPAFRETRNGYSIRDHSIGAHLGFIDKYLPHVADTHVGLLQIDTSYRQANQQLIDQLIQYPRRGNTLFVFSVDFAHHVTESVAIFHDQKTIDTLSDPQTTSMPPLEVDCPNCLLIARNLARAFDQPHFHLYGRTSVANIGVSQEPYDNTSHIFGTFQASPPPSANTIRDPTIQTIIDYRTTTQNYQPLYGIMFGDSHTGRGWTINKHSPAENLSCLYHGFDHTKKPRHRHNRLLYGFDIASINFESALCERSYTIPTSKSVTIRSEPDTIPLLRELGVTMFNLANNHSYDFGTKCYDRGKQIIQEHGIIPVGDGRYGESEIHIQQLSGRSIAFAGFNEVGELIHRDSKIEKVKQLASQGHKIIVNVHRGIEYHTTHSPHQEKIAHALADAGADLIIGHHPHVIQDREIYNDVPIFYSLGNFLFDQPQSETLSGMGVMFAISPEQLVIDTIGFQRQSHDYRIQCSSLQ